MSKAEYNFSRNLLKASSSNSLQEAKKEWLEVYNETRMTKDGQCICQRGGIKFIKYFYNVKTKLTICVGSTCCKKFDFGVDKIKNKILGDIFKNDILKGEYQVIDNIIEYTNSVKEQLINYFKTYTLSKTISTLKKAAEEIKTLINDYKLDYLNSIFNVLSNQIKLIEEEEKLKVYSIEIYRKSYIEGFGDIFVDKHKFSSIKECEDFISKLPIGITHNGKYRQENTNVCVKILLNNEIINIFNKKTKQSCWEERIDKDGKTYWYHIYKYETRFTNPNI